MSVSFPTRPSAHARGGASRPGNPTRASHCRCVGGPMCLGTPGVCLRCGRYIKDTIADTWRQRAQASRRKPKPKAA